MKKRIKKEFSGSDRRVSPRLKPSSVPFLANVSFNQGYDVEVVDISRGGMLLKTDVRLRPQTKIMLRLVTRGGVFKRTGCVLRSSIVSLNGSPVYQAAVAFEDPFPMLDSLMDNPAEQPKKTASKDRADLIEDKSGLQDIVPDGEGTRVPAILTVVAKEECEASLRRSLTRNSW